MRKILALLGSVSAVTLFCAQTIGPYPGSLFGVGTPGDLVAVGTTGQAIDSSGLTIANGGTGFVNVPTDFGIRNIIGTSQAITTSWPAAGWEIAEGTAASPITTAGPSLKVSRTENITAATCGANALDNACNAAIAAYAVSTSSDGMQLTGIFGGALGNTSHDSVGITTIGRQISPGTGRGTGAYVEGRRDSSSALTMGVEVRSNNQTASPITHSTTGASTTQGVWITSGGLATNGAAISLGIVGGITWDAGFVATVGCCSTVTFEDNSSASTSILINGTHSTAQIAGTGFSINSTGAFTALSYNVTGSTAPANGIYEQAANVVGISASSTTYAFIKNNQVVIGDNAGGIQSGDNFVVRKNAASLQGMTIYNGDGSGTAQTNIYLGNSTNTAEANITLNGGGFSGGLGANALAINALGGMWLQGNGTSALSIGTTGKITLYNQTSTTTALAFAVCAATNANTGTGGLMYLDSSACATSAKEFKNPIGLLSAEDAISGLAKLQPAIWSFKDASYDGAREHVGIYADDVATMDRRCAVYGSDEKVKNYEDRCLIGYLVAAQQQQEKRLEILERRLH